MEKTNWDDLHTRILAEIVQVSAFHLKKGRKTERQRMRGYLLGLETVSIPPTKVGGFTASPEGVD